MALIICLSTLIGGCGSTSDITNNTSSNIIENISSTESIEIMIETEVVVSTEEMTETEAVDATEEMTETEAVGETEVMTEADADVVFLEEENLTQALEEPERIEEKIDEIFEQESALDQVQLNSAYMLNYLTVLTTEISSSNASKVFLEETYNSLINNTSPNVDEETQKQLGKLLDKRVLG